MYRRKRYISNVDILNDIFKDCNADVSDSNLTCTGSSVQGHVDFGGGVSLYSGSVYCFANDIGGSGCL